MSTVQIAANRANAQKSTGPRTEQGKREASRNAVKHGLTARHSVISIEDREAYDDLRAELMREHCPQSTQETMLVTQIVDSFWRLQRARALETALFERDLEESADPNMSLLGTFEKNSRQFENLRRYAAAFERSYYRALNELGKLQTERRKELARNGFVSYPAREAAPEAPIPSPADPRTPPRHPDSRPTPENRKQTGLPTLK